MSHSETGAIDAIICHISKLRCYCCHQSRNYPGSAYNTRRQKHQKVVAGGHAIHRLGTAHCWNRESRRDGLGAFQMHSLLSRHVHNGNIDLFMQGGANNSVADKGVYRPLPRKCRSAQCMLLPMLEQRILAAYRVCRYTFKYGSSRRAGFVYYSSVVCETLSMRMDFVR